MNHITPKRIFLIDGTGAIISATLLGYVLVIYNEYIGMPISTLKFLSSIAAVFAIYSITNFFILKSNPSYYIRLIAIANTIYCLTTLSLMVYHFQTLTILGIVYFLGEIFIIIGIVKLEMKIAKHAK